MPGVSPRPAGGVLGVGDDEVEALAAEQPGTARPTICDARRPTMSPMKRIGGMVLVFTSPYPTDRVSRMTRSP